MSEASAWRLDLARRLAAPYAESSAACAVLGGSVAQGLADRWSDLDVVVYWDAIDSDWLQESRAAGERITWVESFPGNAWLEQYRLGTLKADVAHMRIGWLHELLDGLLSGDEAGVTALDVARGVEEAIVLFGEERWAPLRARVAEYPLALRLAVVRGHLSFYPSWIYDGMGRERGDLFVFYEYVLLTVRNLVGVLAGLNGTWVAPDKLKRPGAVVAGMELAPRDAARRVDALLDLPRERVRAELDDLVAATLDLVDAHLPEVDTAAARALWQRRGEPTDAPPQLQ